MLPTKKRLWCILLLLHFLSVSVYAQEPYAVFSESILTFYYDVNKASSKGMDIKPFLSAEECTWKAHAGSIATVVFDISFANCNTLTSTAYWFCHFTKLKQIHGIQNLNTKNVTDMSAMFYECSGLTSLDVSGFNTDNATNMYGMFYGCSSLTSLDVSSFNTANVTSMKRMFYNCSSLKSLDVSHFNTVNVKYMGSMFDGCSGLTSLDLSNFNTANVMDMGAMFYGCSGLTSLDVSNFNTANVTSMGGMFNGCSGLVRLDLSNFNTANVTYMRWMFYNCGGLARLDLSNFNTENVTDMESMFYNCDGLTRLDLSNFNTTNVTNMRNMFYNCSSLTRLDVSNFNTANVTDMHGMFEFCTRLMSLDVSGFNTENVTNMYGMFYGCSRLTSLDVSNFNTANVMTMQEMFSGCSSLTNLDVSNFNTANVTDMGGMFCDCSSLTSLDVSHFNTKNVTKMSFTWGYSGVRFGSGMFEGCSCLTSLDVSHFNTENVTDMANMFKGCSGLTSLDLSSFSTGHVTYMANMFKGCSGLKTIYADSGWDTRKVTWGNDMFSGCTSLVGGKGTAYDETHIDYTYARIDKIGIDMPGYFTDKNAPACEVVQFVADGYMLTLKTNTPDVTIYYSLNGGKPTTVYSGPLTMTGDCTIKAYATRDGYTNSDVKTFEFHVDSGTLATPVIAHNGNRIGISTTTEQAAIYYTLDGTVPTAESMAYTDSIIVDRNCTIKAIALRENWFPSKVATLEVDWFKVKDVAFKQTGCVITLTTETEGATILYSLDGSEPTVNYSGPLTMTGDCTIKAYATRDGYTASDVKAFVFDADIVTVATPVIAHDGNRIGISTIMEQAVIYYTLDGTAPTAESMAYTDSITVDRNCTVKAIALRENWFPSKVATLEVDWFKVTDIAFEQTGCVITLTTETEGATILYSLDGSEPSINYNEPLAMTGDCTIKAYATRDGYAASDVTVFEFHADGVTVAAPVITHDGNRIGISTTTEQAAVFYTLDGTAPTAASTTYTDSIAVTENCTVKAIALRENWFPSKVATLEVDWFKVANVEFAHDGNQIALSTITENATIYYRLSTGGQDFAKYEQTLTMTGDCTIEAYATRNGYNNSDTTNYEFLANGVTVAAPMITHNGNRIVISTTTEQASLYYTLDGTAPTAASTAYTDSIIVDRNCTVKAIALRENWFPSKVATLEVDWFKVTDIAFEQTGCVITLTTETEGATILYSMDGSEPTINYNEPLAMTGDCTIKAYAIRDGYAASDVTVFEFHADGVTVAAPVITHDGNRIGISTTTEQAAIYYTLDGTVPTAESTAYTDSITVTENCTVKAIALRENWFDSEVTTFTVDWFASDGDKTAIMAAITLIEEELATMKSEQGRNQTALQQLRLRAEEQLPRCDTLQSMHSCMTLEMEEAEKRALEERLEACLRNVRKQPQLIRATESTSQTAVAKGDSLSAGLQGIRTTLEAATLVSEVEAIDAEVSIARNGYENAKKLAVVASNETANYSQTLDQQAAELTAIDAIITANTIGITCSYALRQEQLQRLHRYPRLRQLNLKNASIEGNTLPNRALSGMQELLYVELPSSLTTVGSEVLADCPNLATIIWNSNSDISATALAGIQNPNLLLYVNDYTLALNSTIQNVVGNGLARNITLTDNILSDGIHSPANFYAPQAFYVQGEISYTHTYSQTTQTGECRGWETIVLPFDVQTVTHETNGEAVPFASYTAGKKPFWLCRLTEQGFVDADSIRAGIPYIISMPNNEQYHPNYLLNGSIKFSARGVTVPASHPQTDQRGSYRFVPAFQRVAAADTVYALNVGEERFGQAEGSIFISNHSDVYPFQAYRTAASAGVRYLSIADELGGNVTQGIRTLGIERKEDTIYNLQGLPVEVMGKGVYIRNKKKIINH